jgi:cell division protein FtsQ
MVRVLSLALGGLAAAYAVYRGGELVVESSLLQVDRIVVVGNERLSSGDVLALLDGLRGENIVRTDLAGWRARLLASPWVRDASLRRSLPSTVEVTLWEREPMGIGRITGGLYLVDERGAVIDEYGPKYADLDLPIVDGLATGRPGSSGEPDEGRAALAARVIQALQPRRELAKRLSQVDVSDARNAAVILAGDSAVIYVGNEQFLSRLQRYAELAVALRERVPEIDYVDLRFDDRIYVRPAGGRRAEAVPVRR